MLDLIDGSGFWLTGDDANAPPPTPDDSMGGLVGGPRRRPRRIGADLRRPLTDAELAILLVILSDE